MSKKYNTRKMRAEGAVKDLEEAASQAEQYAQNNQEDDTLGYGKQYISRVNYQAANLDTTIKQIRNSGLSEDDQNNLLTRVDSSANSIQSSAPKLRSWEPVSYADVVASTTGKDGRDARNIYQQWQDYLDLKRTEKSAPKTQQELFGKWMSTNPTSKALGYGQYRTEDGEVHESMPEQDKKAVTPDYMSYYTGMDRASLNGLKARFDAHLATMPKDTDAQTEFNQWYDDLSSGKPVFDQYQTEDGETHYTNGKDVTRSYLKNLYGDDAVANGIYGDFQSQIAGKDWAQKDQYSVFNSWINNPEVSEKATGYQIDASKKNISNLQQRINELQSQRKIYAGQAFRRAQIKKIDNDIIDLKNQIAAENDKISGYQKVKDNYHYANYTDQDYQNDISELEEKIKNSYSASNIIVDGTTAPVYKNQSEIDGYKEQLRALNERYQNFRQKNEYSDLSSNADYAEKSQTIDTSKGNSYGVQFGNKWLEFGGDSVYAYINNINGRKDRLTGPGALARGVSNGMSIYDNMTSSQVSDYNYLYSTKGKKAADDYLSYISSELNQKSAQDINTRTKDLADKYPHLADAVAAPNRLLSGIGTIGAAAAKVKQDLTGDYSPVDYNSWWNTPYLVSNSINQQRTENIREGKQTFLGTHGNLGAFGYSTTNSMVDSAAVMGITLATGFPAEVLLGGSAGTQAMMEAKQRGVTDAQAIGTGFAAGIAETLFEHVSLDKLEDLIKTGGKATAKTVIMKLLRQSFYEGSEEVNTTIANTITDALINKDKSQYNASIKEYREKGYTDSEARKLGLKDWWNGVGMDYVGGAVSGLLMGVGGYAAGAAYEGVNNVAESGNVVNSTNMTGQLSENAQALGVKTKTAGTRSESEVQQKLTSLGMNEDEVSRYTEAVRKAVNGDSLSGTERTLLSENQTAQEAVKGMSQGTGFISNLKTGILYDKYTKALQNVTKTDVQNQLLESGESTSDAKKYADIVMRAVSGKSLTKSEEALTSDNRNVAAVIRSIDNGTFSGAIEASGKFSNDVNSRYEESVFGPSSPDAAEAAAPIETPEAVDNLNHTDEARKATLTDTGEAVTITGVETKNGEAMPVVTREDGTKETVSMDAIDASEEMQFLTDVAAKLPSNAGSAMIQSIQPGQRVSDYVVNWSRAYNMAVEGRSLRGIQENSAISTLTKDQISKAVHEGRFEMDSKAYAKLQAIQKNRVTKMGKRSAGSVTFSGADVDGKHYNAVNRSALTEKQQAEIRNVTRLAKATGINFVFYESQADDEGRYHGANGAYKDNTIYLDVNAGLYGENMGENAILRSASHELTHFIEDFSPVQYKELRQFMLDKIDAFQGVSLDELVQQKIDRSGSSLTYSQAVSEVIADGCEMMLKNTKVMDALVTDHFTIAQKIGNFLKGWADDLKKAFAGVDAEHSEAKAMMGYADELQQRWDAALKSAVDNSKGENGQKNSASTEGETQYELRDMDLTVESTEQERYEILKNLYIAPANVVMEKIQDVNLEDYNTRKKSSVIPGFKALAKKLGILNVDLENSHISFPFRFSGKNLSVSLHHQLEYGGSYQDYVKAMSCFENLIQNAVPIEVHTDKKAGTARENADLKQVYVLVSAYRDGKSVVPVQFEVKEFYNYQSGLYLSVVLTKIDLEVLEKKLSAKGDSMSPLLSKSMESEALEAPGVEKSTVPAPLFPDPIVSLRSLFENVNPNDGHFLKYIPDGFLNQDQKQAKAAAIKWRKNEYEQYSDRETDAAYLSAVRNGDTKTAQDMVDAAAKAAGYHVKAYHGTKETFTVFDKSRRGSNYNGWSELGKGFYFSPSKGEAQMWSHSKNPDNLNVMSVYLRTENMLNAREATPDSLMDMLPSRTSRSDLAYAKGNVGQWTTIARANKLDIEESVKSSGYDGIMQLDKKASEYAAQTGQYVVFDPEQIKSSDPVTYDDDGKVIPLSERFNSGKSDIRYQNRDSDGTALSSSQASYFKDSKVRDKDGNLLKVYHGTKASFTVFDRDKIGSTGRFEGSGFNFTPVRERAASYANGANVLEGYLNITKPLSSSEKTMSVSDLTRIIRAADPTGDNIIANYAQNTSDYGKPSFVRREASTTARMIWNASDNDVDIYSELSSADPDAESLIGEFEKLGYDGVIHYRDDGSIKTAVAFNSNQFKNSTNSEPTVDPDIQFSERVTDKDTLDFLNNQDTVRVYRAMQLIDGKLYPPMAARVKDENGKKALVSESRFGAWEQATERPDLIRNGNKFELDKANGSSIDAAYNPYFHTSRSPLNDQFSSAYKRENLVTVEGEIPKSELSSGYKAEFAKDSVGEMKWHSGPVSSKLSGEKTRKVILSRWFKPIRVVSDSEVASRVSELLDGENIEVPYNVVTPSLKSELEKAGVPIQYQERDREYTYDALASKQDMNLTLIDDRISYKPTTEARKNILSKAIYDAKKVGTTNENGNAVVHVDDTNTDVILSTKGLRHGLDRRFSVNAPVILQAGNIIRNSVRINEFTPEKETINSTYVLIGAAKNQKNEPYIVQFVVNRAKNEVTQVDVLYSVNAKTEPAGSLSPEITDLPATLTDSKISIRQLLDYVNRFFPDVLPESVLRHYGRDSRPEGKLGESALYQDRDIDAPITDREILANALSTVAQNESERGLLKRYQDVIGRLNEVQAKLDAQKKILSDKTASKGDLAAARNRAAIYARQIDEQDGKLLKLQAMKPVQAMLQRERQYVKERTQQQVKDAELAGRMAQAKLDAHYRATMERRLDAMKTHNQETVRNLRDRMNESSGRSEQRVRIERNVKKLTTLLLENSDKHHVPEALKGPLASFLGSIDFSSNRSLNGGEKTRKDLRYDQKLRDLYQVLLNHGNDLATKGETEENSVMGWPDLPPDFAVQLKQHLDSVTKTMENLPDTLAETPVNRMTAAQLKDMNTILRTLHHSIRAMNTLLSQGRMQSVSEAARGSIDSMDALGDRPMKYGVGNEKKAEREASRKDFYTWNNMTPYYAFQRFGSGGSDMFTRLKNGWAKLAFNSKAVIDYAAKTYTEAEVKSWEKETHDISLSDGGTVTMTTAQLMAFYETSKREQGRSHLLGGGFKPTGGSAKNHVLTLDDIDSINSVLTDRQREVADKLQNYMQDQGSRWGNEVTMARWGYNFFGEDNYFPIVSDKNNLTAKDPGKDNGLYRLLNLSSTHSLVKGANNAIEVGSIFDIFSSHMSDMAKYNAMVLPTIDAMKWFNYKETASAGDSQIVTRTVQKSMENAWGNGANQYFLNLMKDLNGVKNGGRDESKSSKWMSRYKVAKVAANLRVALLQPTAYLRAGNVLDNSVMVRALAMTPSGLKTSIEEMRKNSGIGLWKSMGFYDTNIGRDISDQIKHAATLSQKITEKSMFMAELGDTMTWGVLWNASKLQAKEEGVTGEALLKRTGEIFDNVIYQTQVVDSTLTRSQYMRDSSVHMKMLTAFMSEPTTSYNMLMDSYLQYSEEARKTNKSDAWKNIRGKMVRAFTTYAMTSVVAALVESVADAFRDDDDEQTFWSKYLEALFGKYGFDGNVVQDLNPISKLPYFKDLFSIIGGFDNTRLDTAWMSDAKQLADMAVELIQAQSGLLDGKNFKYYGNMTTYGYVYKALNFVSSVSGLPIGGATREIATIWNSTVGEFNPGMKLKNYDNSEDKAFRLIRAMKSGDMKTYQSMYDALVQKSIKRGNSKSDATDSANASMTNTIKEAFLNGKLTEEEAAGLVETYAHVYSDDATAKAREWASEKETGIAFSKISDRYIDGTISREDAVNMLVTYGGKEQEDADDAVQKWTMEKEKGIAFSDLSDKFVHGEIDEATAKEYLQTYGRMEEDDASADVLRWTCEKDTGIPYDSIKPKLRAGKIEESYAAELFTKYGRNMDEQDGIDKAYNIVFQKQNPEAKDISDSGAAGYRDFAKDAGVSVKDYYDAWLYKKNTDGDEEKSEREKVEEYIEAMKLTPDQRDAIYYGLGYKSPYSRIAIAMTDGRDVDAMISEEVQKLVSAKGKTEKAATKTVQSGLKTAIKSAQEEKTISQSDAASYLAKYTGLDQEKADAAALKWSMKADTGYDFSDITDLYAAGTVDAYDAKTFYMTYGGYSEERANDKISTLDFIAANPGTDDISSSAVSKYKDYCDGKVDANTFYNTWQYYNDATSDVGSDGKPVSNSKKNKVLNYINGLDISASQKDALYLSMGYAKSALGKAPW